jgi:two-component system, NarL family, response regulator YdfI
MIRVLIKATSPVVKAGLETLIRSYAPFQVVRELSDQTDGAESVIENEPPDVIVAELEERNDESTEEVFDEVADGIPVVLLIRGPTAQWTDALKRGVRAVLPDNATGPQIAAAIEAVAAGLTVLHPIEIESLLPSRAASESLETLPETLTPREIEVLRSMAEGLGNKEIAARLGISEHTVKFHVASVMGKLGAASRTEAVTLGIRHGVILI